MLLSYGLVRLQYEEQTYTLLPSFANIEKIGSPQEIVEYMDILFSESPLYIKLPASLLIINAISDSPLPTEMTGEIDDNLNYTLGADMLPRAFSMIEVAQQLLIHGVVGKLNFEPKEQGKRITKFDPSEYIESAVIYLGISYEEAAKMTMTQFIRAVATKYPEQFKKQDPQGVSEEQQIAMIEYMKQHGMLN